MHLSHAKKIKIDYVTLLSHFSHPIPPLFITCTHEQGSSNPFVCLSVVTTKIATSRHLDIRSIRKHNKSVKVSKKLASVWLESSAQPTDVTNSVF